MPSVDNRGTAPELPFRIARFESRKEPGFPLNELFDEHFELAHLRHLKFSLRRNARRRRSRALMLEAVPEHFGSELPSARAVFRRNARMHAVSP